MSSECECSQYNYEQVVRDSGLIIITKERETDWITFYNKQKGKDSEVSFHADCCGWAELCHDLELDPLVENHPTPEMVMKKNQYYPHSKPYGIFHGGWVCGKIRFYGMNNQFIWLDTKNNPYDVTHNIPEKMTATELWVLHGEYLPHGSLFTNGG